MIISDHEPSFVPSTSKQISELQHQHCKNLQPIHWHTVFYLKLVSPDLTTLALYLVVNSGAKPTIM
jgi:hypothetical protein